MAAHMIPPSEIATEALPANPFDLLRTWRLDVGNAGNQQPNARAAPEDAAAAIITCIQRRRIAPIQLEASWKKP